MRTSNLPEGYQTVYIYYSGHGTEQYFTAPNDKEAEEFILKEKGSTEYNSAFRTGVIIEAEGSYILKRGIPVRCYEFDDNLLITKPFNK